MSKAVEALRAQLGAYRDAVNDLGVEAGVIACHISTSQAARSVAGDGLYLEVIREATLRIKRLSVGYERLRAAALGVSGEMEYLLGHQPRARDDNSVVVDGQNAHALSGALADDLRAGQ